MWTLPSLDTRLGSTTLGNPRPAQTTQRLPPSSPPPAPAQWPTLRVTTTSRDLPPQGLYPHSTLPGHFFQQFLNASPQEISPRPFPPRPARSLLPSLGTHRANTPSLHPPPDQVLLPGFQNYMGHKVRNLVREGNTKATRHSQGLAPEAIQESDPKAGGRGPPLPFPRASVRGRIGLAKVKAPRTLVDRDRQPHAISQADIVWI